MAVKTTIEAAVVELIKEGQRKGIWEFRKTLEPAVEPVALPVVRSNIITEDKTVVVGEKAIPVEQKAPVVDDSQSAEAVAVEPPKVDNKKKVVKKKQQTQPVVDNGPKVSKEQIDVKLH